MPRKKLQEEEKKSKLTIQVNDNLLRKIDELNSNRSAFIEKLIKEYIIEHDKKINNEQKSDI